jgi:hypothetical protein
MIACHSVNRTYYRLSLNEYFSFFYLIPPSHRAPPYDDHAGQPPPVLVIKTRHVLASYYGLLNLPSSAVLSWTSLWSRGRTVGMIGIGLWVVIDSIGCYPADCTTMPCIVKIPRALSFSFPTMASPCWPYTAHTDLTPISLKIANDFVLI